MMADLLVDALRSVHLIGLALGFGLAMFADATAFRTILRPITAADLERLHNLHTAILIGLGVLWASGLGLLYARTGFDLSAFAPKLFVKLGVVILLTLNALTIGSVAMPMFVRGVGRTFGELPSRARLTLGGVAGLSAACWISGLALGVFSFMRTLDLGAALSITGAIYALCVAGGLAAACLAPFVRHGLLPKLAQPAPEPRAPRMRNGFDRDAFLYP
ncbi:hypothetical protein [Pseudaestuariivita atlantica]|uniref:Uncharacterized protein n=1 Tax=Pseudaestuariivita atlantica TaxID=1317121 RepID=A0A0L1JSV9_9RHOB|nr:hypothetical protein [Pseudaestuariivita atlantica]KNG94846.1 hypothetical protein ATO11_05540 [Pseudaestuariivita atlantica]